MWHDDEWIKYLNFLSRVNLRRRKCCRHPPQSSSRSSDSSRLEQKGKGPPIVTHWLAQICPLHLTRHPLGERTLAVVQQRGSPNPGYSVPSREATGSIFTVFGPSQGSNHNLPVSGRTLCNDASQAAGLQAAASWCCWIVHLMNEINCRHLYKHNWLSQWAQFCECLYVPSVMSACSSSDNSVFIYFF